MDPVFIAYLAKFGIDTVLGILAAYKDSGAPTNEQIRGAFIDKKPEDFFKIGPVG